MPVTDGTYEQLSESDIYSRLADFFTAEFGSDRDLTGGSVNRSFLTTLASVLAAETEASLADVYRSAYLDTATGESLDKVVGIIGVRRRAATHATGVVEFSRNTTASTDYVIQSGTVVQTDSSTPVQFETTESVTLQSGTSSVKADVRAIEGGSEGNVGANTITVMPSPPTGVSSVTNPKPTGDPSLTDTDGDTLVVGQDEETDDELRERVREFTTKGGAATHDAIAATMLDVQNVKSVTIFENKTNTDNTGTGGLPEYSFEVVVYGGTDAAVADAIFNEKAVTARDYSGANGSATSATVQSGVTGQTRTIEFSRPAALNVDFTLDLVVTDEYEGDAAVKDAIVSYVGGTDTDSNAVVGVGVGTDVRIDEVEQRINALDGVNGIGSLSTTPSTTTDANGLTVVDVGSNEVAQTDGTDGSISITTTTV